jgi:hypothetical protein
VQNCRYRKNMPIILSAHSGWHLMIDSRWVSITTLLVFGH